MVRNQVDSSSVFRAGLQYCATSNMKRELHGIKREQSLLMGRGFSRNRQKSDIAVEEQAQVVHAIAQHGQAVGAHAEGKSRCSARGPHVAHHVGMHLAPEPAATSQRPASGPLELDVDSALGSVKGKKLGQRNTRSSLSKKVRQNR